MWRFLFVLIITFSCFYCFSEENVYSISMLGQKIGTSTEKWEIIQHKDGKCFIKLDSRSVMEIKRGDDFLKMTTDSAVISECKTFKPLLIKTETKEFSSSVSRFGTIKENIFHAEITKNNNKENFSYPLEDDLTFFSMIFKQHSPEELIKGFRKTVISEESLNKVEVSFSGEKKGDVYVVNVNYSRVPIQFHITNGVIV
ncbi:MAG TPA: hypothetical protein ENN58_02205, partial [bacterium]|nr:hypothetical protein [bacterium]